MPSTWLFNMSYIKIRLMAAFYNKLHVRPPHLLTLNEFSGAAQ